MTLPGFIVRNAFRNKRRAALCVLSVAMSLFLLVTLLVVLNLFTNPPEDAGASLRIAVRNKVSLAAPLPVRQRGILERIEGVQAVTSLTFFGGKYKGEETSFFVQFALEPEKLPSVFGEANLAPGQLEAFVATRNAAIVGVDTAKRYNLKVGDRLPIVGQIYPVDLDLIIVGIYRGTTDDRNVFFQQKYLDELLGDPGTVGMWWLKARSAEEVPAIIDRVNGAFANSSAEVVAETERAFQMGFVSMWGNIKVLISSICSVVVFALVLVSSSTISMAVRERMRELSVLKAVGFRRHELWAFILAESFGLSMVGFLLGGGGAWALYTFVPAATLTMGIFPTLDVTPGIMAIAATVASGLGLVSSLAPAVAITRMSVVEGLKTLD